MERLDEERKMTSAWDELKDLATLREQKSTTKEKVKSIKQLSFGELSDSLSTFAAAIAEPLIRDQIVSSSALTAQMREAWKLAYPNQSIASLNGMRTAQIAGYLKGWKGKYFEVLVRDQLNDGRWIGDIHLGPGEAAHLATHATQPGWDLLITDHHGTVMNELQLKATNSIGYLKQALDHYPSIHIVTTDEVFNASGHLTVQFTDCLTPSGISNAELTNHIRGATDAALHHATLSDFDDLIDVLPALPFIVIAVDEGRQIILQGKTLAAALESGGERIVVSSAALAVGGALTWLDCGILSIPAVLLVRTGINRQFRQKRSVKRLTVAIDRIRSEAGKTKSDASKYDNLIYRSAAL
jgi:hypothetical protein